MKYCFQQQIDLGSYPI